MTTSLDKLLTVAALAALFLLGWSTGAPFFEPFGQGRLTWVTVVALPALLLFVLLRRSPRGLTRFLGDWWPMVGTLAVYESLKHMHANRITEWLGIAPKDELMLRLDELLFFGKTVPLWLDQWGWTADWFIELMRWFYIWVYYAGPVLLLGWAYLFARDRQLFVRLRVGLVLGLLGGYVLYLLVPVAGPLFLVGDRFQHPILGHGRLENLVFDTLRYNWDCFPSLHTAVPWILTVLAWGSVAWWARSAFCLLAGGVTLSTLALRLHYAIDLLAAFAWVWIVYAAVERLAPAGYGRIRIPFPRAWTRRLFAPGPARVGLNLLLASTGLVAAAAALSVVVLERLFAPWWNGPVPSSAAVLGGIGAGIAAARWLPLPLLGRRPAHPLAVPLGGALTLVGWLLVIYLGWPAWIGAAARLAAVAGGLEVAAIVLSTALTLPVGLGCGWCQPASPALRRLRLPARSRAALAVVASAGALAGLVATPRLLPALGLDRSLLAAAALAAVAAWLLAGLRRRGGARIPTPASSGAAGIARSAAPAIAGFLLGLLSLTWVYLFPVFVGDSGRAFSAIVFSLVTAGLLSRLLPIRVTRGGWGWILAGGGVALALSAALWPTVPEALLANRSELTSPAEVEALRLRFLLLLTLPSSFLLLLAARLGEGSQRRLGAGGAALAAGALAGFLAIAAIGSEGSLLLASGLALLLGCAAAAIFTSRTPVRLASVVAAALAVPLLDLSPWTWRTMVAEEHLFLRRGPRGAVLALEESPWEGMIALERPPGAGGAQPARLRVNGSLRPGPEDRETLRAGFVVSLLHAKAPSRALLVDDASGAARAALVGLEIEAVAVIDTAVSPAEPGAGDRNAELLPGATRVGPRLALLATAGTWDLITSEVGDFWLDRWRSLQSRDFYRQAKTRLADGGVFAQAISLRRLLPRELMATVAGLRSTFAEVSLWLFGDWAVLIATDHAQILQPVPAARLARALPGLLPTDTGAEADLSRWLSGRLLAPADLDRLLEQNPIPADDDRNRRLALRAHNVGLSGIDLADSHRRAFAAWASFAPPPAAAGTPALVAAAAAAASPRRRLAPGGESGAGGERPSSALAPPPGVDR